MLKVTDYKVIRGDRLDGFNLLCSSHVEAGWQPRGLMQYVNDCYTQVFVRYE